MTIYKEQRSCWTTSLIIQGGESKNRRVKTQHAAIWLRMHWSQKYQQDGERRLLSGMNWSCCTYGALA